MIARIQEPERPILQAMLRGFRRVCPECGEGRMFGGFLKTADYCSHCRLPIHYHRADDAPPYFTILILGHIIIPLVLLTEKQWAPPEWLHYVVWLPLTLAACLLMLPRIKGILIGLQWSRRMHGFGGDFD